MLSIRRTNAGWAVAVIMLLFSLAALIVVAGPSAPVVGASAPTGGEVAAVRFQQVSSPRRESAPYEPGPPPRTGPASVFRALIDPVWGNNVRANTDTQSPNRAQQEPSIAINPLNPLNVVAAAKDERAGVNTKQIWIYTSTDGGASWINQIFPHQTPLPGFSSDPVVKFTDDGICYVTSLPYGSGSVGIQVAKSTDGGITFSTGTRVTTNGGADKEWMWIDNFPTSPYYHRMYVAWMDFAPGFRVTYSTDRGQTWVQSPLGQSAYQFPMPIVYPNGDLAVMYADFSTLENVRSTSGGTTWSTSQTIGPYVSANCPSDNSGCGIWRNPSVPVIAVNPLNGNAVVAWADGSDGTAKIEYVLGTNNGTTWGTPQMLAPPGVANTYQVQPWVEADEAGTFHAIWLDDRENPDTSIFNVFYSQSTDDGQTWSTASRISTASFDLRIGIPSNYGRAAGDYINVTAYSGNVYAAWTDTRSGTGEDIYVVRGIMGGGTPTPSPTGTPPTNTPTRTATATSTASSTSTRTNTPLPTNTAPPSNTAMPSNTPTNVPPSQTSTPSNPTVTATACTLQFTDVPPGSTFYENILCLACRGIINGYNTGCETGNPCFKPGNNVTRGQLAKIVSNSAGFSEPAGAQQFEDVPPGHTFYDFVWRLADRGIINGYPCGGPGEPCAPPDNLPYFRPNANVTRGQISKIVAEAAGLTQPAGAQQFEDVPPGHTFYDYIWRLTSLGIMQGYPCGGPGEPCVDPNFLPYFRPGASATRGQASKIVANTFFPGCKTPVSACEGIPPSVNMQITPGNCELADTTFVFVGSGFSANESVGVYLTDPDGAIFGAPFQVETDGNGVTDAVVFSTLQNYPPGTWTLTMEGVISQRTAFGYFRLLSP
jgi:hypothetical protein